MKTLTILSLVLRSLSAQTTQPTEVPVGPVLVKGDLSAALMAFPQPGLGVVQKLIPYLPAMPARQTQYGLMISLATSNPNTTAYAVTVTIQTADGLVKQYPLTIPVKDATVSGYVTGFVWTGTGDPKFAVSKVVEMTVIPIPPDGIKTFSQAVAQ